MGMYTELVIKCEVKKDLPKEVEDVLQSLFGLADAEDIQENSLPNHPFFKNPRWKIIGRCASFSHHPENVSSYTKGYIFSRSDLKNYGNEIELFLDWLDPYIEELSGKCIGWIWYEEWDEPLLVYKK